MCHTCDAQASLEHVVGRPGVIVVKLQQWVIFKESRSPAAGISLQQTRQVTLIHSYDIDMSHLHKSKQDDAGGDRDPLTSTATDWACRSQGGRMGRGRVTSQYAVREARAPKPSREEGDRVREDREKEDRGRDGRRLQKSSDSDPLSPALERSDRNHSWKCIAEKRGQGEKKKDKMPSETEGSYMVRLHHKSFIVL